MLRDIQLYGFFLLYIYFSLLLKFLVVDLLRKHDPMQLLDWSFDWKYMVRGLVLDKKRGNILKVNPVDLYFSILLPNLAYVALMLFLAEISGIKYML